MAFCSGCGAQMPEGSAVCPACGKSNTSPAVTTSTTGGMSDNVAGMLAYITIIPAIVFLVIEPYNRNRFIRFHSFQNIFFHVSWFVLWVVLAMIGHIPVFGWLTILVWPLVGLGGFILWFVLVLKAYQGQMFKLPFIGDMAEKQANIV